MYKRHLPGTRGNRVRRRVARILHGQTDRVAELEKYPARCDFEKYLANVCRRGCNMNGTVKYLSYIIFIKTD